MKRTVRTVIGRPWAIVLAVAMMLQPLAALEGYGAEVMIVSSMQSAVDTDLSASPHNDHVRTLAPKMSASGHCDFPPSGSPSVGCDCMMCCVAELQVTSSRILAKIRPLKCGPFAEAFDPVSRAKKPDYRPPRLI